jgi:16S rRNA (adenine1518-N6/adenine1519-N6)-dimethyltransferase
MTPHRRRPSANDSRSTHRRGGVVRQELALIGQRPRKALGQHFLTRPDVAQRIVDLARLEPGDRVLEIGPGLGALTDILAARAAALWLVEIDAVLATRLRHRYAGTPHVHVVEADVLSVSFRDLLGTHAQAVVVANLPYNIATAVLRALLAEADCFQRLVVMVQLEVAERLRARPGSKAYGALSVLTQFAARVERGFRVHPDAFVPPPKVGSEIIVVEPHVLPPVTVADVMLFERVVHAAFNQRRKQLVNSLRSIASDPGSALRAAGIDPVRRAETLSLAEFAALTNAVTVEEA